MKKLGFNFYLDKLPDCRFKTIVNTMKQHLKEDADVIEVNGLPIYFNMSFKRIGINFSAGADSTILLFILAKIIKEFNLNIEIYPITVTRYYKDKDYLDEGRDYLEVAKEKTLKYLQEMFPNIIKDSIWQFLPESFEITPIENLRLKDREKFSHLFGKAHADVYFFVCLNDYLIKKHRLEALYNGTTTNPVGLELEWAPKFRNEDVKDIEHLMISIERLNKKEEIKNGQIFLPFGFIEKHWIMAQYDNFDLLDLKSLTRSCVEVDDSDGGCGRLNCFHCNERKWGNENKGMFLKEFHQ